MDRSLPFHSGLATIVPPSNQPVTAGTLTPYDALSEPLDLTNGPAHIALALSATRHASKPTPA